MAAFSTSFWFAVCSVSAAAAGVAYLARPLPDARPQSSAQALDAIDRQTPALRDVTVPEVAEHAPAPGSVQTSAQTPLTLPFSIDPMGRLAVSHKTLPVLDSWLTLFGRGESQAAIEARLRAELPAQAAERAWTLLRQYASYRDAERELQRQIKLLDTPPTRRELLDKTMALRRRHFDTVTVQELFGVQEARGLYASEVERIFGDPALNEAQQMQRLLALRMALPPEVAMQEFGGSEFSFALERQVAQMRARGESDAEVLYLRRQFVDTEGAKSVIDQEREQQDMQRQAWELRHPAYVRQRNELLNAEMDVLDKQQRLAELVRQHIPPEEAARARVYSGL